MAQVDQGRRVAVAVEQEVAVRQLRRTVGEVVNVEMGVELQNQRLPLRRGELVVDGQDAEMVAGDPKQEVAAPEFSPRRPPTLLPP